MEMSCYGIEDQKHIGDLLDMEEKYKKTNQERKKQHMLVNTHNEVVALPSSITRSPMIGANQSF